VYPSHGRSGYVALREGETRCRQRLIKLWLHVRWDFVEHMYVILETVLMDVFTCDKGDLCKGYTHAEGRGILDAFPCACFLVLVEG
jgi:hypothetical protein